MALQSPGGAGIVVNNWSASHNVARDRHPFFLLIPLFARFMPQQQTAIIFMNL